MKILIAHNCHYVGGGGDRVAWESSKLFENKDHIIIPFSMKNPKNWYTEYSKYFINEIDYSNIKISFNNLKTAIKMIYSFEAKENIEKLIKATNPDIAHLHNIYGRLTPSILHSLKKYDVPIVLTLHDYKLICPSYSMVNHGKICEKCKGGKYYRSIITKCHKNSLLASFLYCVETYLHKWMGIYINNIDYFISPSSFIMNKMIEFGMPSKKSIHIPNFIKANSYIPSFKTSDYFIYFGRVSHEKGIFTLIKSVEHLKSAQLFIAGDGSLRKDLETFVNENKMSNVKFLGHLMGEELAKTIRNASFTVLPSECYENCPMSILESFAFGKPVIGAKIGGIPEIIEDGKDGLLFEPNNSEDLTEKINYLLKNPSKVIEMGKNARKKVEQKYNDEIYYQKLMKLYGRL